ncbi:hypothetical protein [Pseudomonas putida]|uniref:Uncharacterized protein n=1 Tax=Pseudomonas putida TaxID=303 RepID=A0A8I1JI85_PSEPU|nr:hypothetical protein [Pseudomonas putida]MBI6882713.1 hypothetical protein [Pseudomonas putida]
MDASKLKQLLATGPLLIEFQEQADDLEGYAYCGMRAHLIDVALQADDVATIKVSYKAFDEYNKSFEKATYYDENRKPVLTAREAGYYELEDEYYVSSKDDLTAYFSVLSDSVLGLWAEFIASGQENYVSWLEDQLRAARGLE